MSACSKQVRLLLVLYFSKCVLLSLNIYLMVLDLSIDLLDL